MVLRDTFDSLKTAWQNLADSLRDAEALPAIHPDLPRGEVALLRKRMQICLEARGGEVSARQRAAALGQVYLNLSPKGRRRFLKLLARDFPADREEIASASEALRDAASPAEYLRAERRLREALLSPRLRLLKQFIVLPQGVKFLIDLRADLLGHLEQSPHLQGLDGELRELLATWFDVGFLALRRITWDSPAALLEKLIDYEAVHEIHSWDDLRNRLESDRRCYAFFHPAMPEEPLIFVEVALVGGMTGNIQTLLDQEAPETDPGAADTAIFYSISNAQKGLRGISFGHFLIKQVADALSHEFPGLKTFATLSPIPGFASWLGRVLGGESEDWLEEAAREAVLLVADRLQVPPLLEEILAVPEWYRRQGVEELLREPLLRLCVRYLHATGERGALLDPVERFHLGNGARIERLNWLGDTSAKGMRQSCGLMVNYLYRLEEIEKNHELFVTEGRIAAASAVRQLQRPPAAESGRRGRFGRMLGIG